MLKHYLVYGTQTLLPYSVCLLVPLASEFNFYIWSSDVKLAHLQSTEPLTRCVFIMNISPKFELEPHQCSKLLKPSYGLSDSSELWLVALHNYLTKDLQMK